MHDGSGDPNSRLVDRVVRDRNGEVVGVIVDVYSCSRSRTAAWFAISSGFFGTRRLLAPVAGASLLDGGVVLSHDRADLEAAPQVEVHVVVGPADDQRLRHHFAVCDRRRPTTSPNDKGITSP
jgi:hypothetical protein